MGLETVELVLAVEELFGITIPDASAEKIATVGQLQDFVFAELSKRTDNTRTSVEVFDVLRALIAHQMRIDPSQIRRESRFVQDLKMD